MKNQKIFERLSPPSICMVLSHSSHSLSAKTLPTFTVDLYFLPPNDLPDEKTRRKIISWDWVTRPAPLIRVRRKLYLQLMPRQRHKNRSLKKKNSFQKICALLLYGCHYKLIFVYVSS